MDDRDDALAPLATAGVEVSLDPGCLLWQAGDPGTHAAYLVEGVLEVISETEDGEILILRTLTAGALLGEMSSLDGARHSATVRVPQPCRLRLIAAENLRDIVFSTPRLAQRLFRLQSERIRALSLQMAALAFDGVACRVARHLLERANVSGMALRTTHQEIGERVAATRESVTKALGLLARDGAVRLRRGEVVVCDLDALRAFAH